MKAYTKWNDDRGSYKAFAAMQHMPLSCAYLCEDCHSVGNCSERCPACASTALINLAGILNREPPMEEPRISYAHAFGYKDTSLAA